MNAACGSHSSAAPIWRDALILLVALVTRALPAERDFSTAAMASDAISLASPGKNPPDHWCPVTTQTLIGINVLQHATPN
jgi:hypothetical protein